MKSQTIKQIYIETASARLPNAQCLPFSLYTDQEAYRLEQKKIFHSDWVFVCTETQLPEPGDYFALTLAEEPIIIIRGKDNHLRALSNICRHRGTPLNNEGTGNSVRMVCPYHAWTYSSEGHLISAPYTSETEIDKSSHCLPEFALDTWQGLVFVSLIDGLQPVNERFAPLDRYLSQYHYTQFDTYYDGKTEQWQCNWKLAMENAMESYHLFKVHRDTLETVTPTREAFYIEGGTDWSLTGGKYKSTGSAITNWLAGNENVTHQHYLLIALPPSFVGILSTESFAWLSVHPINAAESIVRSGALSFSAGSSISEFLSGDDGEEEFTAAFFAEDKMICERVQRGMYATHGHGGSLIEMERIVVDFHNYLAKRIADAVESTIYQAQENIFIPTEPL